MPHATGLVQRTAGPCVSGHHHPSARERFEGAVDAGSREAVASGDQSFVDLIGASVTSQRHQGVVHSKAAVGDAKPSFTQSVDHARWAASIHRCFPQTSSDRDEGVLADPVDALEALDPSAGTPSVTSLSATWSNQLRTSSVNRRGVGARAERLARSGSSAPAWRSAPDP
jgi:hypothetical protein